MEENLLFTSKTSYNEEVFFRAYKKLYKSDIGLHIFVTLFSIFLSVVFVWAKSYYLLVFSLSIMGVIIERVFRKRRWINYYVKKALDTTPNMVSNIEYYDDFMLIENEFESNSTKRKIYYDSIKVIKSDQEYYYINTQYFMVAINKTNCTGDIDALIKKIIKKNQLNNKYKKILLLVMFILSLVSIFLALGNVAILVELSPTPDFPFMMTDFMWVFLLYTPIPLVSGIIGISLSNYNVGPKKNIISGMIVFFLLCIIGFMPNIIGLKIEHDTYYVTKLEEKINIDLPDDSYVSSLSNYPTDNIDVAMIKIPYENSLEFFKYIISDSGWKDNNELVEDVLNPFILVNTIDYDYFLVYNQTLDIYNNCDGKIIYLAYDVETRIIYVATYR